MWSSYLVDFRQLLHLRAMQDSERQANHLHVLATRRGADIPRPRADIKGDGFLQPGNEEMCAFVDDLVRDSADSVEDDGAGAAFDVVDGGRGEREGGRGGNGPFVD